MIFIVPSIFSLLSFYLPVPVHRMLAQSMSVQIMESGNFSTLLVMKEIHVQMHEMGLGYKLVY